MIKQLSILILFLMSINTIFAAHPVRMLTGSLAESVTLSFQDHQMQERSYKSNCISNVTIKVEVDSLEYLNSSYACQDELQVDPRMRLKVIDDLVYAVNRWGEIDEEKGVIGKIENDILSITIERIEEMDIPTMTLNTEGCPTQDVKWKKVQLKNNLSLSFNIQGESLQLTRNVLEQQIVSKMVRLNNCRVSFYRKNIISTRTRTMSGVLR